MQRLFRSRVAVATEPSSGFFLVGNQHDSDDDGTPDQVETSLGLDPFDPDTDGDGVPDGRELLAGSDPFAADTDGDGLPDSVELSWGRIATNGLSRWIDLSESTNRIVLFSDADDDAVYVPVPVDFRLFGITMTNLAVNANGLVGWSAGEPPFRAGRSSNDRPGRIPLSDDPSATAAAFWDDLRVRPSMESCVSFASSGTDGAKTAVVEFSNMGFVSGGSNDFVSFQVQFSEAETNAVLVVFSEASGRGTGSSATVGARSTRDDGIAYAFNEPDSVFPGLAVECHFGFGSDPSKTDTDGDGLPDGDELAAGTDPRLADTDGDGLSDGEEIATGTDPLDDDTDDDLLPDGWEVEQGLDPLDDDDGLSDGDDAVEADPDGDGLSNGMESFVGTDWHLADTDGDGVSDGAEWRQGSDPLDPADSASRDTVETTIRFGDESGSHSEKYEATVTPVSGDTRPPVKLRNREFGEPDELTVHLVSNAVYAVSLRHVASNRPSPDLDYTLGISATDVSSRLAALVLDPDGLTGTYDDVSLSRFAATARVAVVRARLLADKNRDGAIGDADNTPGPLRLWINDDRDDGSIADGDSDVPTGGTGSHFNVVSCNCTDDHVNGLSDLEDYFPVWLDVSEALSVLQAAYPASRIAIRLSQADAAVGIVNTDLVRSGAGGYLRNPVVSTGYASTDDVIVGSAGTEYPSSDFARLLANPDKGVSLIEGLKASCEPLELELRLDGRTALKRQLALSISPVEDFYRWVNLRGAVGGSVNRPTNLSEPANFPDSESNGKNVVFVHGFNVTEREARGWNAEMFKRLWQSGCNAKYHAATWYGDVGYPNGMYYHSDANNAFLSAADLATYVSGLSGETTLMAHSLGNMVASSAIQDWFLSVSRYFMLNAAVPAEAYDGSQWNTNSVGNRMLHPDWEEYEPRTWCSAWFTNFHDPDDSRRRLAWRGRSADVFSKTTLYNFHSGTEDSVGDQVLEVNANRPDMIDALHYSFPWTIETGHLAWQKQEFGKGRLASINWHVAGTTWAGWGFSGDNVPATTANAMTEAQLRSSPVFRHSPDTMFVSPIPYTDRCEILTYGIPALSGPAGTRVLHFSDVPGIDGARNIDMDTCRSSHQEWGRNGYPFYVRWLHSDWKNMALPYVIPLFEHFMIKGSLQ